MKNKEKLSQYLTINHFTASLLSIVLFFVVKIFNKIDMMDVRINENITRISIVETNIDNIEKDIDKIEIKIN